ncbi:MAG: N-acetylmuramoyl-L-alanine amidase, partial [Clostridiales bacterium]|nr:N-acetylmuramoyl-L-alanine amidase [Clostridiales bacterium]
LNYTDSKADAGTTYYYKVKAGIVNGVKSNSSAAVAITCRCAKPVVKITLTQKGDPKLTWNAVTGASQYEVYRATSKNGTYTKMFTTSNLSYTNTSAKAGTTYYYKVKAISKVKSVANSVFSTVVSIKAK